MVNAHQRNTRCGLTLRSSGTPTARRAGHRAQGLRPILRSLSNASRRWRPLSSTLGSTKPIMQRSSRKCACRRELNSHDEAKPPMPARHGELTRRRQSTQRSQQPDLSQGRRDRRPIKTHDVAASGGNRRQQRAVAEHVSPRMNKDKVNSDWASGAYARNQSYEFNVAVSGARRAAPCESWGGAADAERRDCSCPGAQQEAKCSACKNTRVVATHRVLPNPTLKRSTNGRPPGPVWRYAVHFRQPGPGVPPLPPA